MEKETFFEKDMHTVTIFLLPQYFSILLIFQYPLIANPFPSPNPLLSALLLTPSLSQGVDIFQGCPQDRCYVQPCTQIHTTTDALSLVLMILSVADPGENLTGALHSNF